MTENPKTETQIRTRLHNYELSSKDMVQSPQVLFKYSH